MSDQWWEGPLAGFDTETTSADPNAARIVTASLIVETPGQPVEGWTWLLDPGVEIPEGATAVHGITTEKARAEGVPAAAGIHDIRKTLLTVDCPLVVMNASFDLTVLDREIQYHLGIAGFEAHSLPWPVVDPFVLDKQLDRYRKGSRRLDAMSQHYGVTLTNAHDASADALAAIGIVRAMGRIAGFPPAEELHRRQIEWKEKQVDSLESYFIRSGQFDGVPLRREWPVVPGVPA